MTEIPVSHAPPKVRRLSRPAGMTVANIIEALGETVTFEYQGETGRPFRGVATALRRREVRRRFWVLRDRSWERGGVDPYAESETTPEEDIQKALDQGAEGIICPSSYKALPGLADRNVFFVDNTVEFVSRMVEAQRRLVRGRRVIAVTGSAGKTSTTAMLAHALRALADDAKVQYDARNRNYLHWALSYLSRSHRFDHTVLEISGAALSQEWEDFSVSADVAIVTSIAEAHLDHHGSLEGVARDKSNIFKNPPRDGMALVNVDAPHADVLLSRAESEGARVLTYGEGSRADIRLVDYDLATGRVKANIAGLDVEYTLSAKGRHMALNSVAVLATLRDLGLDWAAGVVALKSFVPPTGRNQVVEVPVDGGGTFTLIDGSYNANPASMRASLSNVAETPAKGRKIAVLGDILELGDDAKTVHRSLVKDIRAARLECLHLIGEQLTGLRVRDRRLAREVHRWDDVEQLIEAFPGSVAEGDLVLIKGSGATGLKGLASVFLERADTGED